MAGQGITRQKIKCNEWLKVFFYFLIGFSCAVPFVLISSLIQGDKINEEKERESFSESRRHTTTPDDDLVLSDKYTEERQEGKTDETILISTANKNEWKTASTSTPFLRKNLVSPKVDERLVFDIMSVGSKQRHHYVQTQRDALGNHKDVRHFFEITEDDDIDQDCQNLEPEDAARITQFCLDQPRIDSVASKHPALAMFHPYFNERYPNSTGWVCAQKRPIDGLKKVLDLYSAPGATLPDYLIIIDDDTWLSLPAIHSNFEESYRNSSEPIVMVGCLDRWTNKLAVGWGGFGTFLSKGALQNLLRPVDCALVNSDEFSRDVCQQIENDLFGERRSFRNGMSVAELIQAYVSAENFSNYRTWTEQGYCLHSDWVWGYFFNYYPISVERKNQPELRGVKTKHRMHSYKDSESHFLEIKKTIFQQNLAGQCEYDHEDFCNEESHICHYITPKSMNRTVISSKKNTTHPQAIQKMLLDGEVSRFIKKNVPDFEELLKKYLPPAVSNNRTLVILWGNVRGGEPTWKSFYKHLLDPNQADLALMIPSKAQKDSSLYQHAQYVWEFTEPNDWSTAIDVHFGINSTDNPSWRNIANKTYGLSGPFSGTKEDPKSSGAIRGLLHAWISENLQRLGLVEKYDRFVVTRTDQYYTIEIDLDKLDPSKIWVPKGEDHNGICDRFYVCGRTHILKSLNTHPPAILNPEKYKSFGGNIESFVKLRWEEEGIFQHVRRFQRRMFVAAVEEDTSRWGIRKKAFVEDGISIGYKYYDEFYAAMMAQNFHRLEAKEHDHEHSKALQVWSFDDSEFRFITPKMPQCTALEPNEIDFTLVTIATMDRLSTMMKYQCQMWGHLRPVSIAVYANNTISPKFVQDELSRVGCHSNTTRVQVLDSTLYPQKTFPYNVLRNMAMSAVRTSHAVYVDLETVVSNGLYDTLFKERWLLTNPRFGFALPTFEFRPECRLNGTACFDPDLSDVPLTKEDLLKVWPGDNKTVQPFYADFRWGQSSTPFDKFLEKPDDTLLRIDCIELDHDNMFHWEPYFVVQVCNGLPLSQESFTGYGFNKSSWVHELLRRGYDFLALGKGFVMHLPHKNSESKTGFYEDTVEAEVAYWRTFDDWLNKFVPGEMVIPKVSVAETDPHCSKMNISLEDNYSLFMKKNNPGVL